MVLRIHQLAPQIANQIAAGEVIERPASVVKELLENALDAGADSITIEVGFGGLNQIKISDNGSGIIAEDLPLAVAAHATSKIKELNDLYAIQSMGFRGEALASIASVAKLIISSKPKDQEHAAQIEVKNSEYRLSPCARSSGTTVDVVDLFFNAPVRKRFLKSDKIEFQAIDTVVKRFAMSAPQIAIHLMHNGKSVLNLPAAKNESLQWVRLTKLFGSSFTEGAISIEVERGGMQLYGWISHPQYQRSQSDRQWVYINQRMVKDKLILHALKQAYESFLHPGRYPSCLLYLKVAAAEVDVNVHPTKHEVRFQHPRLVHDFFTSQLAKALELKPMHEQAAIIDYASSIAPSVGYDLAEPQNSPLKYGLPPTRPQAIDEGKWVILNRRHALLIKDGEPYLVDAGALYMEWLQHELEQQPLPWKSRPLLVPVSFPGIANTMSIELQKTLLQLGFEIEPHQGRIKSLPVHMPYLDLTAFFSSALRDDVSFLKSLMYQSQRAVLSSLSPEERAELYHFCFKSKHNESFCTPLNEERCGKLLHV